MNRALLLSALALSVNDCYCNAEAEPVAYSAPVNPDFDLQRSSKNLAELVICESSDNIHYDCKLPENVREQLRRGLELQNSQE